EEALDVTQETFLQMLKGLSRFREQANFYTWLHRIALNRCIDWGRSRSRRPPPISLDDLLDEGFVQPVDGRAASRPDLALMTQERHGQTDPAIAAGPGGLRG